MVVNDLSNDFERIRKMTKREIKKLTEGLDNATLTRNRIKRYKSDLGRCGKNAGLAAKIQEQLQVVQKHLETFKVKTNKNVVLPNLAVGFCKTPAQAALIIEKEPKGFTQEEITEQIRKARELINSTTLCPAAKAAIQKRFDELGGWTTIYDAEQNKGKQEVTKNFAYNAFMNALRELFNLRRLAQWETMGSYGHDFSNLDMFQNYLSELADKSRIRYDKPSREWTLLDQEEQEKVNGINGLAKKASFMPQSWLKPMNEFLSKKVRLVQKVRPWAEGILNIGGNRVKCLEDVVEHTSFKKEGSNNQWFLRLRFIDLGEGSPIYYEVIEEMESKAQNRKPIQKRVTPIPRLEGEALEIYNKAKQLAMQSRDIMKGSFR
jgi:hypothetical protein